VISEAERSVATKETTKVRQLINNNKKAASSAAFRILFSRPEIG
jgi:hypothetical protein